MAPPAPAQKINLKDKVEDGEMDLSMSDLQEVPVKEIAAVRKVHSLDLSNNRIAVLPKNFPTLSNLTKLDLSKNGLRELPENFGELVKLRHLDLYKNELQHLPLSFANLKALRWLDLKDNPLMPAIATVAGPCLENKQCQKCAQDVVSFYVQLRAKVEEERELRRLQREQRNKQAAGAQKKKSKGKDKKGALAKDGDGGGGSSETTVAASKIKKEPTTTTAGSRDAVANGRTLLCNFLVYTLTFLAVLGVALFVLTAAKVERVQIVEDYVTELWNKSVVQSLPHEYRHVGVLAGQSIRYLHNVTGDGAATLIRYAIKLGGDNVVYTELVAVVTNVTQTATEFYARIFKGQRSSVV